MALGAWRGPTCALVCAELRVPATGRGGVASSRCASSRADKGRAEAEEAGVGKATEARAGRAEFERKVVRARGRQRHPSAERNLGFRGLNAGALPVQRAGEQLDMEGAMAELMRPTDPDVVPLHKR